MNKSFEDRILQAIDEGRDISEVSDWQLRCVIPMPEKFTMEEMTQPSLTKTFGLKKKELRVLHLSDAIHGPGLYSKQIAQREHMKAATVRKRLSRARKKARKRLTAGKP